MKRLFVKVSSIAAILAGLNLVPLSAQDNEGKAPVPSRATGNAGSEVYRASDVMNLPVKNDDGTEIGRIKDLVINGESREVLYAVVAMNDAKVKDSLYVMPWTAFQPNYGRANAIQYAVLGLSQAVWMQGPSYSSSQWGQTSFSQWGPRVNDYYANHIPAATAANRRSTSVKANEPVINDSKAKDSTAAQAKENRPAKTGEKPASKDESQKPAAQPKAKSNPESTTAEKPAVIETEPAAKTSRLPAPKNPDPAGPKIHAPAPQQPKSTAPNPK